MGDITIDKIVHYADVLAIPCFLISFLYFLNKKNKTLLEIFIMLFLLSGLILDIIFTYHFLNKN
jgi:hypothetical protein